MNDHGFVACAYNRTVAKVDQFLANEAKGRSLPISLDRKRIVLASFSSSPSPSSFSPSLLPLYFSTLFLPSFLPPPFLFFVSPTPFSFSLFFFLPSLPLPSPSPPSPPIHPLPPSLPLFIFPFLWPQAPT